MADPVRERSRSPRLDNLHLKTPRRRRVKSSPDGPLFHGRSSQSQGDVSGHGLDIEQDCDALDGMIKDGDNWLGRARALQEEPPENNTPYRQDWIPGLGRSQVWFKFDDESTQDYKGPAQGLSTPLSNGFASDDPMQRGQALATPIRGEQGASGCVSQSPPALVDSSRSTSGTSTPTTAGGQMMSIISMPADSSASTSVVLPIQVGSEKWFTEGGARRALQGWAYKNAHILGRYRPKPGPGTNKKDRARAWLAGQTKQKLEQYLNSAMPDVDTITYKVGIAPQEKKVTKEVQQWDGRSRFCLLTFQHQGWEFEPPPHLREGGRIKEVEDYCKKGCPFVTQLWQRAYTELMLLVSTLEVFRYTMSLELCPKTLKEKAIMKFHFHVIFEWSRRVRLGFAEKITFCGAPVGHIKTDGTDLYSTYTKKISRKICADAAHFYGQVEKVGSIGSCTNFQAFVDFNVNPKWITTWVQRQKITWSIATKLYLECGSNVKHNMANLEDMERGMNRLAMMEHRNFVLNHLAKNRKRFKDPEGVERWEGQFEKILERYMPLILTGKGGTGKTMWGLSYFARKATTPAEFVRLREKMLFLTCTSILLPDVGKYRYGKHLGIVYDEGTPEMIWWNREIFQGLPEVSTTADTTTHMYANHVCMSGCRQIITCNDWWERIWYLPRVQRDWFWENCIVIDVKEPLYTNIPLYPPAFAGSAVAS